jgi:hypothetical protein
MAIRNRHDFHAFSTLRWSDFRPATFGRNKRRIDDAFFFVQHAFVAKLVGNIRQNSTQNLVAAPSLKAPMHSFVVRIALRQERIRKRFPEEHIPDGRPGRKPIPTRHVLEAVLWILNRCAMAKKLSKFRADADALFVRQPNHSSFITSNDTSWPNRWPDQRYRCQAC